jgi:hypothetical protein
LSHNEEQPKVGNIVSDYYIGNTHVMICDDYCRGQTKEQAEAIIDRIASKALPHIIAAENNERIKTKSVTIQESTLVRK